MDSYRKVNGHMESDLTAKIKHSFFQTAIMPILLYECTPWTLTKHMEKKLDSNYTRMLQAVLNNYWRQHPAKQHSYSHLPTITKTIQVKQTRHAGHCWRSKDKLISYILLWIPSHGQAKVGRPARTYLQQLCADTGCSLEDLLGVMDDRDRCQERVREICAGSTWRWWYFGAWILYMLDNLQNDKIWILLTQKQINNDHSRPSIWQERTLNFLCIFLQSFLFVTCYFTFHMEVLWQSG